ncbi:MAG: acetyltransferase [Candidatus Cloacimonadia bacterium]
MNKKNIILIGGGGHCKSCIDVIEQESKYKIAGIVDLKEKLREKVLGYEIIANDEDLPELIRDYKYYLITVGQIKSPEKRIRLFNYLKQLGAQFPTIVSPFAYVSSHSYIDEGTIIMHHALVNADVTIGKNCIINTKVLIEHDVTIEDYCHIATSAVINGGVYIEKNTFVGSNVTIKEAVSIERDSVIQAGSYISKNI